MTNKKPLAVYIHIPFCKQKCLYCDFLSAPAAHYPLWQQTKERYVEALLCDCRLTLQELSKDYFAASVFIGGGTPSVLEGGQIAEILHTVFTAMESDRDAEVSMEVNPGTIEGEYFTALKAAGINRISFGLQSACERELRALGRIHDYKAFEKNYHAARQAGFANINVDLMYGLPWQTVESWRETLRCVMEENPEHISAYSLIIEEGTPFYSLYEEGKSPLPSEEEQDGIDAVTGQMMEKYGYRQYEISNYAKPGCECRHNIVYWKRGDYIGMGPGAASLLGEYRFRRTTDTEEYIVQAEKGNFAKEEEQRLSASEAMAEYMFLGLRMCEGVSFTEFFQIFGVGLPEIYGDVLKELKTKGLLLIEGDRAALSQRGRMLGNLVFSAFI